MNNINIYILSLLNNDKRKEIISKNKKLFPQIKVIKSTNGFNKQEVIDEFNKLDTTFYQLNKYKNTNFNTYGSLANFITKVKIMKYQVDNKIPYICFIEDDLLLKPNFVSFIQEKKDKYLKDNINMLRLDKWGEGYITSLESSKRILEHIKRTGIIQNIDNQLRENCGKELRILKTPWELVVNTNKGDCLKTEMLEPNFKQLLLNNKKKSLLNNKEYLEENNKKYYNYNIKKPKGYLDNY
jgi:GR25 family glycosyltransferase involved in LPS biosynthesis